MRITPERVAEEWEWIREREHVVTVLNDTRDRLAVAFDTHVSHVDREQYQAEVDAVFADGDLAVNVAALVALLRDLDVTDDYPGFVVDEQLGRQLAGTIAGGQPLTTLAEATFHVADIEVHGDPDESAGTDDLDAALAAGFQTRIPGWEWTERESPFAVDRD